MSVKKAAEWKARSWLAIKQDTTILDEATRAALKYKARKLTGATEELLRLLDKFSLLPVGALDAGFNWKLVSRPDEKRLLLSVNWKRTKVPF